MATTLGTRNRFLLVVLQREAPPAHVGHTNVSSTQFLRSAAVLKKQTRPSRALSARSFRWLPSLHGSGRWTSIGTWTLWLSEHYFPPVCFPVHDRTRDKHQPHEDGNFEKTIVDACSLRHCIGPEEEGPISVTCDILPGGHGLISKAAPDVIFERTKCMVRARGRSRHDRELCVTGRSSNLKAGFDLSWRVLIEGEACLQEEAAEAPAPPTAPGCSSAASTSAAAPGTSSSEFVWPQHMVQAELFSMWQSGFELGRWVGQEAQILAQETGQCLLSACFNASFFHSEHTHYSHTVHTHTLFTHTHTLFVHMFEVQRLISAAWHACHEPGSSKARRGILN